MHILKSKLCEVNKQKDNKKSTKEMRDRERDSKQERGRQIEKKSLSSRRKSGGFRDRLFGHVTVERLQSIRRVAPS